MILMKSDKMRLEISRSLNVVPTDFFNIEEDIEIHIPINVTMINENAFTCRDDTPKFNVDIFYDGTIEEWNNLKKGLIVEKTEEDWYGYYYHNGPRYETIRIYYSWFKNHEKINVIIHCVDGDSKIDNYVDRKHPVREEKQ